MPNQLDILDILDILEWGPNEDYFTEKVLVRT